MTKEKAGEYISVGVSSCLLGRKVRYDGGHKRDRFVADVLGLYFHFVPVCPELEAGMGIPRESVQLIGNPDAPGIVGNQTGGDFTNRINRYAKKRVQQPDISILSGFILKGNSPSCGMERMRVYVKPGK